MTLDSVVSPQVLNKYLILIDVKSGRFKYQSGRARDEAKKRKSPAKSGRVGIYENSKCKLEIESQSALDQAKSFSQMAYGDSAYLQFLKC